MLPKEIGNLLSYVIYFRMEEKMVRALCFDSFKNGSWNGILDTCFWSLPFNIYSFTLWTDWLKFCHILDIFCQFFVVTQDDARQHWTYSSAVPLLCWPQPLGNSLLLSALKGLCCCSPWATGDSKKGSFSRSWVHTVWVVCQKQVMCCLLKISNFLLGTYRKIILCCIRWHLCYWIGLLTHLMKGLMDV